MTIVSVYRFEMYDIESDRSSIRPLRATREAIDRFGGKIIEESREEIDQSELDADGCLRDKPPKEGSEYHG